MHAKGVGSLLRLSIIKRSDKPEEWVMRFYPLVVGLACLPLMNFYNFLMLASRVIRIIFYYCDDFVSTQCNVTATPGWHFLIKTLTCAAGVVWLLHLTLPQHDDPEDSRKASEGGATSRAGEIEKLHALYERGVLTEDEFAAGKRTVLGEEEKTYLTSKPAKPRTPGTGGASSAAAQISNFD